MAKTATPRSPTSNRAPAPRHPAPPAQPDRHGHHPWAQDLLELGVSPDARVNCTEPAVAFAAPKTRP
ncbi:MAG: hypothetical protein JSR48_06275 [Verrucomicrobia bacterium]|nr:hypothetical protein [Verrucomicrobiota bacterium]